MRWMRHFEVERRDSLSWWVVEVIGLAWVELGCPFPLQVLEFGLETPCVFVCQDGTFLPLFLVLHSGIDGRTHVRSSGAESIRDRGYCPFSCPGRSVVGWLVGRFTHSLWP
jgi:hypothetical protein